MKFESEVVVSEIIPAIRKIIAEKLRQDYGHTQEEVAIAMELTQPAVSQYLKGKRADSEMIEKLRNDPQTSVLLDEAASKAAKNQDFVQEIREIIATGRDKGIFQEKLEDAEKVI